MAAIIQVNGGKSISPSKLNPYLKQQKAADSFDVDAIERQFRIKSKEGNVIHQTISSSQVVN